MENKPADVVYSVGEVALLLKKSKSWVYRAAKRGAITVAKVGSSLRVARAEVRRLLAPSNAEAVTAWTREELDRYERKKDTLTLKAIGARCSPKNMGNASAPPPQEPSSGQKDKGPFAV